MNRSHTCGLAIVCALAAAPFATTLFAQSKPPSHRGDGGDRDDARPRPSREEAVERAWEEWGKSFGGRWERWGEETGKRWEAWAQEHEQDWEAWAQEQEKVWTEFAEAMEQGDEVDVSRILALSLKQLEKMPIEGIVRQATGDVERMVSPDGPLAGLEGLDEVIRLSVETALMAAESAVAEEIQDAGPEINDVLSQVLTEVRRASGDVRAAVENDRRKTTAKSETEWKRLRERRPARDAEPDTDDGDRSRTERQLEMLEKLQREIEERDHALEEMHREIRELQQELRRLKHQKSGVRL